MAADASDFDYGSATAPPGALFVAAEEPLLVYPSVAAAERDLEAIDVADGVYPVAYGPTGKPYRIGSRGNRVVIEPTGESNRPDELRGLLLRYLESAGQPFDEASSTSELVEQVWQWESEYWQENDPYGDRFSKPVPGWCCLAFVLIPATVIYVLITRDWAAITLVVVMIPLFWGVGALAKRKADQMDFRRN